MLTYILCLVASKHTFTVEGNEFVMDGKPFRYVSGSYHYFRQHPDYWEENIKKMANCGLNALQTYVAWNVHEPQPGQYNWEGFGDLERFVNLCEKYGLYVILRPGPFICAEWEGAGFPYWLQKTGIVKIRQMDDLWLKYNDAWLEVLYNKMRSHFFVNGGNILSIQIENEYGGALECDHNYLRHLCEVTRRVLGDEVFLFTTDSAEEQYMKCGTVTEYALATVDFPTVGSEPSQKFALAQKWNKDGLFHGGPNVDSEFYTGWIDHWGENHHRVETDVVISVFEKILACNASVNIYMFYGGTNFGYWAGANGDKSSYYQPDPTSYDYDAPLSEAGDMTYKYQRIKETIAKYYPNNIKNYDVSNTTKKSYGKVKLTKSTTLFNNLETLSEREINTLKLKSFEAVSQPYGFVIYRTQTNGGNLKFGQVNDRAIIFVNGKYVDWIQRNKEHDIKVEAGQLDILVENLGRINTGIPFLDSKGLTSVKLDGTEIQGWKMIPINLEDCTKLSYTEQFKFHEPAFFRGTFEVDQIGDTFINPTGFKHGFIFINGFNVGRHWEIGPQSNYYVPGPILKKGTNEIIIFEAEDITSVPEVTFEDIPKLDK